MPESADTVLAQRLGKALIDAGMKLVTAESCTGGGIAQLVTSVPGSSQWFERGFVTYSNEAKQEVLGVPLDVLTAFGAVSEQTAIAMVEGALSSSRADISVAVTGIAGPDGGTKQKPVGTVCFAWCDRDGNTTSATVVFEGDRQQVRQQTVLMAVQGLCDRLENINKG